MSQKVVLILDPGVDLEKKVNRILSDHPDMVLDRFEGVPVQRIGGEEIMTAVVLRVKTRGEEDTEDLTPHTLEGQPLPQPPGDSRTYGDSRKCAKCRGQGRVEGPCEGYMDCPACDGKGY